jgi:chorismate synthase
MRIIIAGAKSSGKTTTARALAETLGIPHVDLDDVILEVAAAAGQRHRTCADLCRAVGEDAFRAMERKAATRGDLGGYQVVATGGSTLADPACRRGLRPSAYWVYLHASLECLWGRISEVGVPAYLADSPDPRAAFAERYARIDEILSHHCDLQVDADGRAVSDIVEDIAAGLNADLAVRSRAPNTLGDVIRLTTFGESHGPMLGAVLDGVRPGLPLSASDIQKDLDRRRPGQSAVSTARKEADAVEIVSGVFEGRTTGAPVAVLIRNRDSRSSHYDAIKDIFRPGHADYTFWQKYGIRDHRGGGRSSGRETAARVAGGAIARKILSERGITIRAFTSRIGGVRAEQVDYEEIERNPVRCPDPAAARRMEQVILAAKERGDSVGGVIQLDVHNVPAGLGDPVFAKLDARLASGLFSIGAVKGVEIGSGFACAEMTGREHNDEMADGGFSSNHAGGVLGGISTGQPLVARVAIKPTASISQSQETMDIRGDNRTITVEGRHDPCIVPRAVAVVEAMAALTVLDALEVQHRLRPGPGEPGA